METDEMQVTEASSSAPTQEVDMEVSAAPKPATEAEPVEVEAEAGPLVVRFCREAVAAADAPAAVRVVAEALECPGLYVFGELLAVRSVAQLSTHPAHSAHHRLLETFAYGTYASYTSARPALPPLSAPMLKKLRQLTLVSEASANKCLQLDTLQATLGLTGRRELEDLIIEAIYADLVGGRLDQSRAVFEVDFALGRDVRLEELGAIADTLKTWTETADGLLSTMDSLVAEADGEKAAHRKKEAAFNGKVSKLKSELKKPGCRALEGGDPEAMFSGLRMDLERKPAKAKKGAGSSKSRFWSKS